MIAVFSVQFDSMHQLNLAWAKHLLSDEYDLPQPVKLAFSKLLNSFHLIICRLQGTESESELDDYHPEKYWLQLENANHREIELFLLKVESNQLSPLEIALLFQLIRDHSFYMGQLHLLCQQHNIALVNEYLYKLNLDE
jgi:hypothetical protein